MRLRLSLALMYPHADAAGSFTGSFYPEQYYSCSVGEQQWFDPWSSLSSQKHDRLPMSDEFAPTYAASTTAEQRRPSSCYSGLSTPGLSWRDSSCSPLSAIEELPVAHAVPEAISFSAASQSQKVTSSPVAAGFSCNPAALFASPDEAQARLCSTYHIAPGPAPALPAAHDPAAWSANMPSLSLSTALRQLDEQQALPMQGPSSSHLPSSSSASPLASAPAQMPELQHPKPFRPYVPPWQTATEFDVEEFVAAKDHASYQTVDDQASHAGPSAIPSLGDGARLEQGESAGGYFCEPEEEVDMDWDFEDQSTPPQEGYAWNYPPYASSSATAYAIASGTESWLGQQIVPQVLPPDALLYQPLSTATTSTFWTLPNQTSYTYPHFS